MRHFRNFCLAVFLGCLSPVLVYVGAGVALYYSRKQASLLKQEHPELSCSIDSDCPPGYRCIGGRCVPFSII